MRPGYLGITLAAAGLGLFTLQSPGPGHWGPHHSAGHPALADGRALYLDHCAPCHGERGFGDGPAAYLLYPRPRDLTAKSFRLASTGNGVPTDEDLLAVITRGLLGSSMPPHEHLSLEDRTAIVGEVRRIMTEEAAKRMLEEAEVAGESLDPAVARELTHVAPGEVLNPPASPPVSKELLARGRMQYVRSCALCHDQDGTGRSRTDMVDAQGDPILARDITAGILKGGSEPVEIFRRIRLGLPGSPMPASDLSDDDVWAVTHYVRSLIRPGVQESLSQKKTIFRAGRVEGSLTTDPRASVWARVPAQWIALTPLFWSQQRVDGLMVQVAHDGSQVAMRLVYEDATADTSQLDQSAFSDGAAIQIAAAENPPFLAMGQKGRPVELWYWRASYQAAQETSGDLTGLGARTINDIDMSLTEPPIGSHSSRSQHPVIAHQPLFITGWGAGNPVSDPKRPSVETLTAAGFSTATGRGPAHSPAQGRGRHDRGYWEVVILRPLQVEGDLLPLPVGKSFSAAFAVWNGAAKDRNGQKQFSIWHQIVLE
jgi:mono/diheme cytochrome c family protein